MKLKDLPENIQEQAFLFTNKIVRNLEGEPVELLDLLDKTYAAGAGQYMIKAANLYQALIGLKMAVLNNRGIELIGLVEECLKENKPEIL